MKKIIGLDSLRFGAFLMIFFHHTLPWATHAYLGVDFFFVLSSFLLTLLALKEIETTGSFSKINFFMRRALRIFPLYFLILIFSFVALPFLAKAFNFDITLPQKEYLYWFFLSNYDYSNSLFALKFLWSIAVEEQFYLIFIAFSFLFAKRLWIFIALLLLSYLGFMFYATQNGISTYSHTITHFSNFAMGVLGAYLLKLQKLKTKHAFLMTILSFSALFFFKNEITFHLVLSIFFSSLILSFIPISHYLKDYKLFKVTEYLGQYTYGLYIYSGFIITFGIKFISIDNIYLSMLVKLALLIPVAIASYHLFEKKFLRLKSGFRN